MVAKNLLPVYGGTPAVWTLCMLFFQFILLAAYAYVWLLNKSSQWRSIHSLVIIICLLLMPVHFQPLQLLSAPEWAISYTLLSQVGLPIFLIATTAPLLQSAYSKTDYKDAADPYYLYAASNFGSLLALLAYPWLIEQFIGLHRQLILWNFGFGIYLVFLLIVLYGLNYKVPRLSERSSSVFSLAMMRWVFLSFIPCSLMLGVTRYSTTDIAATPLFWIVPLALYLLSFVLTFTEKTFISHNWISKYSIYFLLATVAVFCFKPTQIYSVQAIVINLVGFFVLALYCHGALYINRPKAESLTLFYFCLALGGVFAGIFNGLVAPHLFNQVYEYPLVLVLSAVILPSASKKFKFLMPIVLCGLLFLPMYQQNTLFLKRSFYAVNRVEDKAGIHVFHSQSTLHGLQDMMESKPPNGFRAYYGGLKPVIEALQQEYPALTVTLMGLGTGTMLCQFRDSDTVNAIEIDQQVIDIAQNSSLFTYVRDCLPTTYFIKNDGRLAVADLPNASQHLIVLDAFNSDAIPVHLMTVEAFQLYRSKLTQDGIILINLSNRHVHLLPVINAIAKKLDLINLHLVHKGDPKQGQFDSEWALMTANQNAAFGIMQNSNWQFVAQGKEVVWTDDYSNIIALL
jgi:hypothetical protein